ncbi:MAG: CHAT domain-containing protein [Magnetococcales bacterium]|nr:CHAT domain-containing protein [Magnetococcales bacterium]
MRPPLFPGRWLAGLLMGLVLCLTAAETVAGASDPLDQTAQSEADKGQVAWDQKEIATALGHFLAAHALRPDNLDYIRNAGTLAMMAGDHAGALDLFRKGIETAVQAEDRATLALFHEQLAKLLEESLPEWVESRLAAAESLPDTPEIQTAVAVWSALMEQVATLRAAGTPDQALPLAREAMKTASTQFGPDHLATINSLREMAALHTEMDQGEQAGAIYRQLLESARKSLGEEHPETLAVQQQIADFEHLRGNGETAEKILEHIRHTQTTALGQDHPLTLGAEVRWASFLIGQGRFAEAVAILSPVCSRYAASHGEWHPLVFDCHRRHAEAAMGQGDMKEAERHFLRARDASRLSGPDTDPKRIEIQTGLAESLRLQARFDEAEKILASLLALPLSKDAPGDTVRSQMLGAMARLDEDMGRFGPAEDRYREVLALEKKTLGENHPNTIATQSDLAGLLRRKGELVQAEKMFLDAYERFRRLLGPRHPNTLVAANDFSLTLEEEGLYETAEPLFRMVYNLSSEVFGAEHPSTLANLNNLALLYESQGTFDKAQPLYEQAIAIARKTRGDGHPDTVAFLNNLGYLHMLRGHFTKAREVFDEVYTSWSVSLGEEHQKTLKALNNLARSILGQQKPQEALSLFEKALGLRRSVLGDRHPDTQRTMLDLGRTFLAQGKTSEGRDLLARTLELNETTLGPEHPYTFETRNALAEAFEQGNDMKGAFSVRKEGFVRRNRFLERVLWVAGANAREGYIRLHRPELDSFIALLARMPGTDEEIARMALDISLERKGLLLKISSEVQQIATLGQDPQLAPLGQRLKNLRKKFTALTLSGPTPQTGTRHLSYLNALEEKIERLEGELGRASQKYRQSVAPVGIDDLVAHLPDQSLLVDFIVYHTDDKQMLLAATLRMDEDTPHFQLITYDDFDGIKTLIAEFRESIQSEELEEDEVKQVGQKLYRQLWGPIAHVAGSLEKVFIVPDGLLNIAPFNALVNEEEEFLLKAVDLYILPSSRDLVPRETPRAKGPIFIVAGPDYDAREDVLEENLEVLDKKRRSSELPDAMRGASTGMRGLKFDPLPGAEKEGKVIMQTIGHRESWGSRFFKKQVAMEMVLREIAASPEIVHIATHGFFLKPDTTLKKRLLKMQRGAETNIPPPGDNPLLRAGLAFAGINQSAPFLGEIDTDNDGVLTAMEVLGLNLGGTRVAVLSACETGLGEIHEGEGVYGLRRAFTEAGVQTVINSLWEVSDAGTQALMTLFYGKLMKGIPAHDALRESQIELLDSSEWSNPYIWSAFFMVGMG